MSRCEDGAQTELRGRERKGLAARISGFLAHSLGRCCWPDRWNNVVEGPGRSISSKGHQTGQSPGEGHPETLCLQGEGGQTGFVGFYLGEHQDLKTTLTEIASPPRPALPRTLQRRGGACSGFCPNTENGAQENRM